MMATARVTILPRIPLTFSELRAGAINAGFTGEDSIIAAAVALAESGGDARAYNPEPASGTPSGLGSYGLWQIYLKAHPEFTGQNLFDPVVNAAAAFSVYSEAGNSFTPWSTFNNGAYLSYVPRGTVV